MPREGRLSARLADSPPSKIPKLQRLTTVPQLLPEAQPGQSGPQCHLAVSANIWVTVQGRGGVHVSNCGFLVTGLTSTSPHSLQGSFTSFSYIPIHCKDRKRAKKEKHKRKKKNMKIESTQTYIMGQRKIEKPGKKGMEGKETRIIKKEKKSRNTGGWGG